MRILIAEHDRAERAALTELLVADGHEVLSTASCAEALKTFERHQPDLALVDIGLTDADGYACIRGIAAVCGSRFPPAMLMASIDDHMTLAKFIESEAADFIDAPGNVHVLRAKIAGFERLREVYLELERFQSRFRQEVRVAQHMFQAVIGRSPSDVDFLRHWTITAGHFSGDLLIYERSSRGCLHILMGDFTGHGLAAAVGALPAADTFFEMTRKGFGIGDIAAAINRRLNEMLPTGHFCAALLARLSPLGEEIEIWNGGQPPLLMLDEAGRAVADVSSFHFPLGVVGPERFDGATATFPLGQVRHVVLYSDGLVEAQNASGQMFGTDGLQRALTGGKACGRELHDRIKAHFVGFLDGMEPHDDVSLLTLDLAAAV